MKKWLRRAVLNHGGRYDFFRALKSDCRVLELGCGQGHNAAILLEFHPAAEVHGVDILNEADVMPCLSYKKADLNAGTIPYPDDHFDAIIFAHVIEHLSAPMELGHEISRVLRRGGQMYVETPNWTSMLVPSFGVCREQYNVFNFFDDPTHVRPWTRQSLFEFVSRSCRLQVNNLGAVRNWRRVLLDIPIIIWGLLRGRRGLVVGSFWNLYGWSIYAVGEKRH